LNKIDLYEAINEIDDDLIISANVYRLHTKKNKLIWASAAAVFVLLSIVFSYQLLRSENQISMGENLPLNISENASVSYIGTGFSKQEILKVIEANKESIISIVEDEYSLTNAKIFIYTKGYRHITCGEKFAINLDSITLPILVNNKILANIEIVRSADETVFTINFGGDRWNKYNAILTENPKSELVFAFLGNTASEVIVLSDNSVIGITQDADIYLDKNVKWYSKLKTPYNTLTSEDLYDAQNLLAIN